MSRCAGQSGRPHTAQARAAKIVPAAFLVFLFLLSGTGFCQDAGPDVSIVPHLVPAARNNAASPPALKIHASSITVDVDLVQIPVTVTDPRERLITSLAINNFALYDSGVQQQIRYLCSEDAPVSIGVIFDMSASMANKIGKAREAVAQFLLTANLQDEFFLIAFSDRPAVLSDFTDSAEQIKDRLSNVVPDHRTALLDAIYLGVDEMRYAKYQRKALLIISDGGDNHSRYTQEEIKSLVKEADVQIYAVGLFSARPKTREEQKGPGILTEITEVSGGRLFTVDQPGDLPAVARRIGIELRSQYLLGYRPNPVPHDGKWHKVKVKLMPPAGLPPLHLHSKQGYYARSQ